MLPLLKIFIGIKKGFFQKMRFWFDFYLTVVKLSYVCVFLSELYDFKGLEYFSFNWNSSEIKNWSISVNGHNILRIVEQ